MNKRTQFDENTFVAYFDDELTQEERDAFEKRLEEDPQLKKQFERYKSTLGLLREMGPVQAPDDLLPTLQKRVSRRSFTQPHITLRFPYELLAVIAVLVAVLYLYFVAVPTPPRNIQTRSPSKAVRIELSVPMPPELKEQFGLTEYGRSAKGQRMFYTSLNQAKLESLVEQTQTMLAKDVSIPERGKNYKVMVLVPPDEDSKKNPPDKKAPQEHKDLP